MSKIAGLFRRGGTYYLRIVLPKNHPLRTKHPCGRWVKSLGSMDYGEARIRASVVQAEILTNACTTKLAVRARSASVDPAENPVMHLRDVYDLWIKSKPLSSDSTAACNRALKLFELQTKNPPIKRLTRAIGDSFRSWLQAQPTTSKTARDRLNWVKSLLKYAAQDLELIPRNPWTGLDIKTRTTQKRRPWADSELSKLLAHPIWQLGEIPTDKKAGGVAAYWIPLLAMYTGARCSELCQLRTADIVVTGSSALMFITDEGLGQHVKSDAGHRTVPIHSELVRLGFIDYVRFIEGEELWPDLPKREGKPGGFFSQYFGRLRKALGVPPTVVLHSFRHNVRSALAEAKVPETTIDRLLGHEPGGSVGAKVYTHVSDQALIDAVETICYSLRPGLQPPPRSR